MFLGNLYKILKYRIGLTFLIAWYPTKMNSLYPDTVPLKFSFTGISTYCIEFLSIINGISSFFYKFILYTFIFYTFIFYNLIFYTFIFYTLLFLYVPFFIQFIFCTVHYLYGSFFIIQNLSFIIGRLGWVICLSWPYWVR